MNQNLSPNPHNHRWGFCELCETEMVFCGKCGNNCCNGGYGSIDGVKCDACSSAYDLQQEGWDNNTYPGRPIYKFYLGLSRKIRNFLEYQAYKIEQLFDMTIGLTLKTLRKK